MNISVFLNVSFNITSTQAVSTPYIRDSTYKPEYYGTHAQYIVLYKSVYSSPLKYSAHIFFFFLRLKLICFYICDRKYFCLRNIPDGRVQDKIIRTENKYSRRIFSVMSTLNAFRLLAVI
jgi:hypothetical protein